MHWERWQHQVSVESVVGSAVTDGTPLLRILRVMVFTGANVVLGVIVQQRPGKPNLCAGIQPPAAAMR